LASITNVPAGTGTPLIVCACVSKKGRPLTTRVGWVAEPLREDKPLRLTKAVWLLVRTIVGVPRKRVEQGVNTKAPVLSSFAT